MRMGRGVEWALHVCCLLATAPPEKSLHVTSLAEFYELSPSYLAKQLQALARAGVVTAVYGTNGGYQLGRPASEISVLDVVEAVQGDEPLFVCTEIRRNGPSGQPDAAYRKPCTIAVVMSRADRAWRTELAAHTIADLVATLPDAVPQPQRAAAIRWMITNAR